MRQIEIEQISMNKLIAARLDVIIAASGYERRARNVANLLASKKIGRRIVLAFEDRPVGERAKNDAAFRRLAYSPVNASGSDGQPMRNIISASIRSSDGVPSIAIDYTSMTRVWYAAALEVLRDDDQLNGVEIYLAYSPASYSPPRPPSPNRYMGPIPGFCRIDLPIRSTALVIGLGYEAERAAGLLGYVEAAETFALIADPGFDERFTKAVVNNNSDLLRRLANDHIMRYPLTDFQAAAAQLTSLCLGLARDHRVILAPLGPKPFAILCLLLAIQFPFLDVWRVSAGERGFAYTRRPSGEPLVLRVRFR